MKRNSWLAVILILVLSYGIYVASVAHNGSLLNVPSGWHTSIDFGRYYIVQHNTILDPSTVQSQTTISSYQTVGAQDIVPKIFFAAVDIVGGSTSFPQDVLSFTLLPIGYLVLIPLSVLAVYEICLKKSKRLFSSLDAVILLSVGIFSIPSLIDIQANLTGNVLARGLFILLIALLLSVITDGGTRSGQTRKTKIALFLFLQVPYYMMYHTWALYLLICMVGFLIFSLVVRKFELTRISLYSIIAYGAVALYIYTQSLFITPLLGIDAAIKGTTALPILTTFGSYSSFSNVLSYVQAIDYTLLLFIISLFCSYFMLNHLKKRKATTSELLLLFLVCDTFLVAFVFFTQGGPAFVLSLALGFAGGVTSLICAAFLLGSNDKNYLSRSVEVAAVIIVVLCVACVLVSETANVYSLTQSEFAGISFAGTNVQNNTAIYSDFRIANVLLYYDQPAIYGPTSHLGTSYEDVMQIFYSNTTSPHQPLDVLIENKQSYCVLTSTYQTQVPLQDATNTALKSANAGFQSNFINDRQFDCVYDSASFNIFYRSR
jgi:hypothetical protein